MKNAKDLYCNYMLILCLRRYPVMWQGHLNLKNDSAAVQLHFLSGNVQLAKLSLPQPTEQSTPTLKIAQRMRLEKTQLEGVGRRMQVSRLYNKKDVQCEGKFEEIILYF